MGRDEFSTGEIICRGPKEETTGFSDYATKDELKGHQSNKILGYILNIIAQVLTKQGTNERRGLKNFLLNVELNFLAQLVRRHFQWILFAGDLANPLSFYFVFISTMLLQRQGLSKLCGSLVVDPSAEHLSGQCLTFFTWQL